MESVTNPNKEKTMTNEWDITRAEIHKHDLDVMCHAMQRALLENDYGIHGDEISTGDQIDFKDDYEQSGIVTGKSGLPFLQVEVQDGRTGKTETIKIHIDQVFGWKPSN